MARFLPFDMGISDGRIPTEQASVAFGLLAGIGGGIAQLIAGRRLSNLDTDTISVGQLALPVLLGGGSTALAAFLLPSA